MKQNKSYLILLFFAAFLAACNSNNNASVNGDDTTSATTTDGTMADTASTTTGALSESDREFMLEAAKGGLMEVEAGKMAQEKATNQRIKDFGAMMVRDHSQANQELKSLASSKNVMLPDTLDEDMREHMESMRKMGGKEFDKHYIDMMKDDHKDDINKFENASNNASDPDVKAFATKTLPVLRMHRDSVDALSAGMK
jgi:putative membrane protein